jgi:predicted nuclease with TOPRIM domain
VIVGGSHPPHIKEKIMNVSTKTIEEQALLINHLSREFNSLNAANGSYISRLHDENSQLSDDLRIAEDEIVELKWVITKLKENKSM